MSKFKMGQPPPHSPRDRIISINFYKFRHQQREGTILPPKKTRFRDPTFQSCLLRNPSL